MEGPLYRNERRNRSTPARSSYPPDRYAIVYLRGNTRQTVEKYDFKIQMS